MGCGVQKGSGDRYRGAELDATLLPKMKVEVVVSKIPVEDVIDVYKRQGGNFPGDHQTFY